MANTQLVDYIKGQFAAGVPKEGILGALRAAGWAEADITESMQSAEANMSSQAAEAKSSGAANFVVVKPATSSVTPASAAKESTSGSQNFSPAKMFTDVEGSKKSADMGSAKSDAKIVEPVVMKVSRDGAMMGYTSGIPSIIKTWLIPGIMGIIILGLAVGLWLTYQSGVNANAALTTQTQADQTTISGLQSQAAKLTSDNAAIMSDRDSTAQSLKIAQSELLFFVVPAGALATAPVQFDLKGTISGTAPLYMFTTAKDGIVLNIKNAKSPDLAAILKALASPMVDIAGTHLPASREVTVTSVNGTIIPSAVPAAVTPASSTAPLNPAAASSTTPAATTTTPKGQ